MSKTKKLITKLKEKYKLVILNDDTFEEKASFNASLWYLIIGAAAFAILFIFLTITTIKYTPLKEYIGGVTDASSKKEIMMGYAKIDSLQKLAQANDAYLKNLQDVISGNVGKNDGAVKLAVADVYNQTFKWVTNAPETITMATSRYNITTEDGSAAIIGINTPQGNWVYTINGSTAAAVRGMKVEGGQITAIQKLKY